MLRNYLYSIVFLASLIIGFSSKADVIPLASAEGQHVLTRIEGYLNNLTSMRSRFLQINDDGSSAEGLFLLNRPGKMRMEYDPPVPFLLLATGNFFVYVDLELEEVSYLPLSKAIIWPILKEKVSLRDPSITIDRIDLKNGVLRIALRKTDDIDQGVIDLIFNPNPLFLKQWLITDSQLRTTMITLLNPISGVFLEDDLFHFHPPWKSKNQER